MATGTILVRVADGSREPFGREISVILFDGAQRRVHWASHQRPNIEFTIPVTNGPNDVYRVIVSARDHRDAGQIGIPLRAGMKSTVHVMLLPRRGLPQFASLAALDRVHPGLRSLVEAFLTRTFGAATDESYQKLQRDNPAGLMTLLSIASSFADFRSPHPLDFVDALTELRGDRFFAEARDEMRAFLAAQTNVFGKANSSLHPGAFESFKEGRFREGNVQFTFGRIPNSTRVKLDGDIDLFADKVSHALLEVLPNDVLNPPSVTDARRAYAMRWMSVQRQRELDQSLPPFEPPFSIVVG
jgi:hypothetical protein